jgi:anti-sigma B factor antagonist
VSFELGQPFEIRHERERANALTMRLYGEFDLSARKSFQAALQRIPDSNVRELVIDLAGVTFIDSSAIRALLDARKQAGHNGVRVVARLPDEGQVLEVLRLTGVDQVLDPLDA